MSSRLYDAGSQGEVDVLRQHIEGMEIQTIAYWNSYLHATAQLGQVNIRGETPLHVAARDGNAETVKELIERAKKVEQEFGNGLGGVVKKMLRATNEDRDMALHMAVRNCHLEVIKLLTEEDPEFEHPANKEEETPLYLAAERGIVEAVVMLLENCRAPTYGGPGGRTALHAATFNLRDETLTALLEKEWMKDLIKKQDAYGWTPLHSATRCRNVEAVKKLLEKDKSVAYVAANGDEGNTALHIAAALGDASIMHEILSYCPNCSEMVNSKGQNILHIAAYYERDLDLAIATDFILERPWLTRHLINRKDNKGNMPLHILNECPGADTCACHEVNSMAWPRPIHMSNGRDIVRKDRDRIIKWKPSKESEVKRTFERMAKTHMIVATLLATISFTASFTIPGGYHVKGPDEGMAVLVRDAAFKTFVVTNTIAVICSTSAVFVHLTASLFNLDDKESDKVEIRYLVAFCLIIIALVAMTVAFIAGTYAVLAHSLGLAIAICVIACSASFVVYASELTTLILKILAECKSDDSPK